MRRSLLTVTLLFTLLALASTAVLLVERIHVDLLRVCASRCPDC